MTSDNVSHHFSATYGEARKKFLDSAKQAGATTESIQNTKANGPSGEPLYTDVARLGPEPGKARAVLFVNSGTHGAEGYCGSGCQVGALRDEMFANLPDGVAVLLTHAINPYGFAWGRRVNEDNIDLNRNYIDHDASYPDDNGYGAIHPFLCPSDLMEKKEEYDTTLFAWIEENGMEAFQEAVSSGQYTYPDGMFYGGNAPAWSNDMWRAGLAKHGEGADKAMMMDFHTGLGPSGYGELLGLGDAAAVQNAFSVWGKDEVSDLQSGDSSSAKVRGDLGEALFEQFEGKWTAAVAVEYGTLDLVTVLDGIRKDNWLEAHGDRSSDQGKEIAANARACFYTETDKWKSDVYVRATWAFEKALAALAN